MQWDKLFNTGRFGASAGSKARRRGSESNSYRQKHPFQRDINEIVFSAAFRRMQGKTQVQSFPVTDYPRTRLTHSLEVAVVGQAIGAAVADALELQGDLAGLLYAAGLAHDIGNAPFGHFGEEVMAQWLVKSRHGRELAAACSQEVIDDYSNFNGNAQGFRLLSGKQSGDTASGINLTYATVAAFTKYPFSVRKGNIQPYKVGFFQREQTAFRTMAAQVGLGRRGEECWQRAPSSLLLEAADDISYLVVDLEDAYRSGCIDFAEAKKMIGLLSGGALRKGVGLTKAQELSYLCDQAIMKLSEEVTKVFCERHRSIIRGEETGNLLAMSEFGRAIEIVRDFSRRGIYQQAGSQQHAEQQRVLHKVMDRCAQALLVGEKRDALYRRLVVSAGEAPVSADDKLVMLFDYVSGMSDAYAYHFLEEALPV